jgi:hypothetical protein
MAPGDLVEMAQNTRQVAYSSQGEWEQVDYVDLEKGERGLVLEDTPDGNGNLVIVLFRGLQCMVWRSRLRVIE